MERRDIMPSPLKKAISTSTYSVNNIEGDCFWHALDKTGLDLVERKSLDFGKETIETKGMPIFSGEKMIRCRPDKGGVRPWLKSDGAILQIHKKDLDPSDWCEAGSAGDIHVIARAALLKGLISTHKCNFLSPYTRICFPSTRTSCGVR
jgi:hypothetical protein